MVAQEEPVEKLIIEAVINVTAGRSAGVKIPEVSINSMQIKKIRERTHLSQTVFAELLNVSPSSVRQWEQGKRVPTGATKVLLELLDQSPHLLDYRIPA